MSNKKYICDICPLKCSLDEFNPIGLCNTVGLVNEEITSVNKGSFEYGIHYIEELGLYHFYPGSTALYLLFPGCNLRCLFCPEWKVVMRKPEEVEGFTGIMKPGDVIDLAVDKGVDGIVFSCSSALNGKYILSITNLAHKNDLYVGLVTNGVINTSYLVKFLRDIDAFLVRFFGFSTRAYSKVSIYPNAHVEAIKIIRKMVDMSRHVEVTYTLITGINDGADELKLFFKSIIDISSKIPVHIRRFNPSFIMSERSPTRNKALRDAYKLAKVSGLKHVYIDDFFEADERNTYCPNDGSLLIKRVGYWIDHFLIKEKMCPKCYKPIYITGSIRRTLDRRLLRFKGLYQGD